MGVSSGPSEPVSESQMGLTAGLAPNLTGDTLSAWARKKLSCRQFTDSPTTSIFVPLPRRLRFWRPSSTRGTRHLFGSSGFKWRRAEEARVVDLKLIWSESAIEDLGAIVRFIALRDGPDMKRRSSVHFVVHF